MAGHAPPTSTPVGPPGGWPPAPPPAPPYVDRGDPRLGPHAGSTLLPTAAPGLAAPPPPLSPRRPPAARRPHPALIGFIAVAVVIALLGAAVAGVAIGRRTDETATAPPTTAPDRRATPPTTAVDPVDPADPLAPDPTDPPGSSGSGGSGGSNGTSLGSTADPQALAAAVADIKAFVERDRGLTFRQDVAITVLADTEFEAQVLAQVESEEEAMRTEGALLVAAGLIPATLDVVAAQRDLLGDGVLGYYDPKTDELVVRGGSDITPFVRQVLAHELTHALDDQHVDLDRPILEEDGDAPFAFLALVEGSAKRVENDYAETFNAAEEQALQEEMLTIGMDQLQTMLTIPLILPRLLMAPYDYGEPFVRSIVTQGGTAALDRAYAEVPVTSEQILVPAAYASHEGPQVVAVPPADGEVIAEGTLGQLMTGFVLHGQDGGGGLGTGGAGGLGELDDESLQALLDLLLEALVDGSGTGEPGEPGEPGGTGGLGGLDDLTATGFPPIPTVAGWGGDHYVTYRANGTVCLRVDWRMDGPAGLAALDGALATWAAGDTKVTLARPDAETRRATRCA